MVWDDFADSWIRTSSTPTIGSFLSSQRTAPPPYGKRWLRRLRLAWAYTGGVAGTVAGHVTAHLCQSPLRLAVTALLLLGLHLVRMGSG